MALMGFVHCCVCVCVFMLWREWTQSNHNDHHCHHHHHNRHGWHFESTIIIITIANIADNEVFMASCWPWLRYRHGNSWQKKSIALLNYSLKLFWPNGAWTLHCVSLVWETRMRVWGRGGEENYDRNSSWNKWNKIRMKSDLGYEGGGACAWGDTAPLVQRALVIGTE